MTDPHDAPKPDDEVAADHAPHDHAPHDHAPHDLGQRLDDLAAVIPSVDVDEARADVRRVTDRRRNLTRLPAAVGAVALVGLLAVAVLTLGGDDPDTIDTSDDTVPTSVTRDDTDGADTDDAEPAPEPTLDPPVAAAQPAQVIDGAARAGSSAGANGAPEYGEWIVPWEDGFLVGSMAFVPQPLPDQLPEEVLALFPQEVIDLFGGELPDTIGEATERLSEAGLLDVVSQIIQDNPEANAAIYGEPTGAPAMDVRFTTDGVTWEPREMTLPSTAAYLTNVTAVGDRLAAVYQVQDPLTGRSVDGIVSVATTNDLTNWTTQDVLVATPPDLPEGINWNVYAQQFAANDNGWVLSVADSVDVDPYVLLPTEEREALENGDGFGLTTDDVGVTIESGHDLGGNPQQTRTFTWDELGVPADVVPMVADQNYSVTLWAATWDGTPTLSDSPALEGPMIATPSGFVAWTDQRWFSPDGITWTSSPLPDDDSWVTGAFNVDGGLIVVSSTSSGETSVRRADEVGADAVELDIPGLPTNALGGFGPMSGSSAGGMILDAQTTDVNSEPLSVEADGYRLTLRQPIGAFDVVDVATGELVASGIPDRSESDGESPITFGEEGVIVTDPDTEEIIVQFPFELLEVAENEYFDGGGGEYAPDFWLLASRDGERFLVEDLDENVDGPTTLATNGDRVLVQAGSDWIAFDMS